MIEFFKQSQKLKEKYIYDNDDITKEKSRKGV